MDKELKLEVVYKTWNNETKTMEETAKTEVTVGCFDTSSAMSIFTKGVMFLLQNVKNPLTRLVLEGWEPPYGDVQYLTTLDLDFMWFSFTFTVATKVVPANFAALYKFLAEKCEMELTFLHLQSIHLDTEGEQALATLIETQKQLDTLVLAPVLAEDGTIWLERLSEIEGVRTLSLTWFSDEGEEDSERQIQAFALKIPLFRKLQHLLMAPLLNLGPETCEVLREGLENNGSIQELLLSGNGRINSQDDKLCEIISCVNSSVTSLTLPRLVFDDSTPYSEGFKKMLQALEEASNVTHLSFSNSCFSDQNFKRLIGKVLKMKSLTSLNLVGVQLSSPGFISGECLDALRSNLRTNKILLKIDLEEPPCWNDYKYDIEFYLQRNHCDGLLTLEDLGVWAILIASILERDWINLGFYLLREKINLLLKSNSSKRIKPASDDADDGQSQERAKKPRNE